MTRARRAAWWITPSLVCVALFWYGLKTWFQSDDFAWLGLSLEVHNFHDLLVALFAPKAQGTIRPLGERAYFMALYGAFGLDALPFHIVTFAAQIANLALVAAVARRVTGSVAAGFWAPLLWTVNSALAEPLGWASVFNQPACALFLLLAFYFLLRYAETGARRWLAWQWGAFLLGFGAQELNLVYPGLAAAYTLCCARKYFRGTLPMFAVSGAYVVLHRVAAPVPAQGEYAMHYTSAILRTLYTYWTWSIGPTFLTTPLRMPHVVMMGLIAAVSAALLIFALRRAVGRFCLSWYVVTLAPVLPLRDHVTEYYPYIPLIGLAIVGGWALAETWRRGAAWKVLAVALALAYVTLTAPEARAASEWLYHRTMAVRKVVLGVEAARQIHQGKAILLDDVGDELFWTAVFDRPFRLFHAENVYVTPDSARQITAHPQWGNLDDYILPLAVVERGLDQDSIVVYSVAGERLRNVTSLYAERARNAPLPRRINAASSLVSYLLGSEWYPPDGGHRWMPRRATLRLAGPDSPSQKLYLSGNCPEEWLRAAPRVVTVTVDGVALPPAEIHQSAFDLAFPLPPAAVGKPEIKVTVEVNVAVTPPADGRELGLVFGVFEIR